MSAPPAHQGHGSQHRRRLPAVYGGLSLERFAEGKTGQQNAYKKRLAANKRALQQKALLKRKYARILKAEFGPEAAARGTAAEAAKDCDVVSDHEDGGADTGRRRKKRRQSEAGVNGTDNDNDDEDEDAESSGGNDGGIRPGSGGGGGGGGSSRSAGGRSNGHREQAKPTLAAAAAAAAAVPGRAAIGQSSLAAVGLSGPGRHDGAPKRQHKPDPFAKARAVAKRRRAEAEARRAEREAAEAAKEQRARERRKQHAALSKRTRRGQPVMANSIQHMLQKLQAGGGDMWAVIIFVLVLSGRVNGQFGMPGMGAPKAEPVSADLPYIKCGVCKAAARELHDAVSLMREEALHHKIHEDEISTHLEAFCDASKPQGKWAAHYDLKEDEDGRLVLDYHADIGKCGAECETIAKSCAKWVDEVDVEELVVALWKNAPPEAVEKGACREWSDRCAMLDPPLPAGHERMDEPFVEKTEQEANMDRFMEEMQRMQDATGQKFSMMGGDEMAGMMGDGGDFGGGDFAGEL